MTGARTVESGLARSVYAVFPVDAYDLLLVDLRPDTLELRVRVLVEEAFSDRPRDCEPVTWADVPLLRACRDDLADRYSAHVPLLYVVRRRGMRPRAHCLATLPLAVLELVNAAAPARD